MGELPPRDSADWPRCMHNNSDFSEIEAKALERWRGIICYLLNIEGKMAEDDEALRRERRDTYYEVLTHADYMEKHPNRH